MSAPQGTSFGLGNNPDYQITDSKGLAILVNGTGTPPTTANVFEVGCIYIQTDGSGNSVWQNTGSSASPSWTLFDTGTAFSLPTSATDAATTTGNSFALTMSALTSGNGILVTTASATSGAALALVSPSSGAIKVGATAANPAFQVDSSTASQVAGLLVKGAATGGTVALSLIDTGSNTNLSINAKGTGTIAIGSVSTGQISIGRAELAVPLFSATITSLGTTQNSTPSAAQLLGGFVTQTGATGAGTVTLPNGTTMSGAVTGVTVGDNFECTFANLGGGFNLVITGATGMTVVGNATVPSGKNATLDFVNTGSNTWNVYVAVSA